MAEKSRLKIERADGSGTAFEVMLNPATYKVSSEFCFSKDSKLNKALPKTFELPALTLDGTGVVPTGTNTPRTVPAQLKALEDLFSAADQSDYKSRPVIVITWGPLRYAGRVKSMSVEYTLFAPTGAPLRATVSLKLIEPDVVDTAANAAVAAPVLARQLQVQAATLPQLCFKFYDDPMRDQAVARANALTSIRNVPAAQKLVF